MLAPKSKATAINWLLNQPVKDVLGPGKESKAKQSHDEYNLFYQYLMLKSRKPKPRSIFAVESDGYGDFDPVFLEVDPNEAFLSISNSGMGAESDHRFRSATAIRSAESAGLEIQAVFTEAAMSFSFIGMNAFANNPIDELRLKKGARESPLKKMRRSDFAIATLRPRRCNILFYERCQCGLEGMNSMGSPIPPQASDKDVSPSTGLTTDEALRRIEKFGPNAVPDTALHPLRRALTKFWAPVPWDARGGDSARDCPRQVC